MKAQHQKDREHLEVVRRSVEDVEPALVATQQDLADVRARGAKLPKAIEASRV